LRKKPGTAGHLAHSVHDFPFALVLKYDVGLVNFDVVNFDVDLGIPVSGAIKKRSLPLLQHILS
jgi:hypothetical protein